MNQRNAVKWLAAAGSFAVLTSCQGKIMPYAAENGMEHSVILQDRESCRRFLMETVSAAEREGRQEVTVTAKEGAVDTLVIAQMFPEVINISRMDFNEKKTENGILTESRIGFEWRGRAPDPSNSGKEEIPEAGYGDGKENRAWRTGDVIVRKIAGKAYRFCCIDDDYQDESGTYGKHALFLSQSVIRSDMDSTEKDRILLAFGEKNHYKSSYVRRWLEKEAEEAVPDAVFVYTGVTSAFTGKTGDGDLSQTRLDGLTRFELPFQECRDRLFLLSLEEAYRYREALWNMEGAGTMYSRGFWLRTPAYQADENGTFVSGNMEYIVDLENGCFRQADTADTGIGICPAFCLPQA